MPLLSSIAAGDDSIDVRFIVEIQKQNRKISTNRVQCHNMCTYNFWHPSADFRCDFYLFGWDTEGHRYTRKTGWHALIHTTNMCFAVAKTVHKYMDISQQQQLQQQEHEKQISTMCRRIRNAGWQFYILHRIWIHKTYISYVCSKFDTYSIKVSPLATSNEHLQKLNRALWKL